MSEVSIHQYQRLLLAHASTNQITNLTLPAMKIFFHYTPLELLIGLKIIRVYETAKAN